MGEIYHSIDLPRGGGRRSECSVNTLNRREKHITGKRGSGMLTVSPKESEIELNDADETMLL